MKRLIRNAIKTPDGTVLRSVHTHDFKTHLDAVSGETYMIDGGLDYTRSYINKTPATDLCLYDDQPHEVQRDVLLWGTYGKDGKEDFKRVAIKDMTTGHIKAVLEECSPSAVLKNCMIEELKFRKAAEK